MAEKQYLFLGDSITDAGHLWEDSPLLLGNGFVRMLGSSPLLKEQNLHNRGQDGFTSADLLRLIRRFTDLDSFDCITILIGINDISVAFFADSSWIPSAFCQNMQAITDILKKNGHCQLILMEPFLFTAPDCHLHMMPLLHTVQDILHRMAYDCHAVYIPLQQALTDAARRLGTDAVTTDGIHLTDTGNRIVADCWLSALFQTNC